MSKIKDYIQFLSLRMFFLPFKTIQEKFAQYVINMGKPEGDYITLAKSQTALAEYFGVARPSLSRAIKNLEREGIIQVKIRKVKILNREKLERLMLSPEKK